MTVDARTEGRLGRLGTLDSKTGTLVVGLDVGGTKTLGAAVDAAGQTVAEVRRSTQILGPGGLVPFLSEVLVEVVTAVGIQPAALDGLGVGLPGVIDPASGTLRHAVNLGIGDDPIDLAGPLGQLIDGPVSVANDVNLAALGTAELLGLSGDVAYLSIGTGVALGLVIDGEVHHGAHGSAGEIGHLPVDPYGPLCVCGQRGCLEAVASGAAIARRWSSPTAAAATAASATTDADTAGTPSPGAGSPGPMVPPDRPVAPAEGGRGPAGDGEAAGGDGDGDPWFQPAAALLRAAADGDERAVAVRDDVCMHLAAAIALVAQTVDPDMVVLGGGVADAGPLLLDAVREALDRRAARSPFLASLDLAKRVLVLPPGLPVGALGAARLALGNVP